MANDKLPETPQDQINRQAEYYSGFNENEDHTPLSKGKYYGYIAGATAYAPWKVRYDELQAENTILKQKNIQIESRLSVCEKEVYDHRKEYHLLQAQAQAMADALEEIKTRIERGKSSASYQIECIRPIVYNALQQFKDGKEAKQEPKPEGWPWVCEYCGKQDCGSDHK